MDILIYHVQLLDHREYMSALGMTIRPVSLMREAAILARKNTNKRPYDAIAIMLKEHNGVYVGWSLIDLGDPEEYRDDNIRPVYFNVKKAYRRKGYGTFLYHIATGWLAKNNFRMEVFPHDEDSQRFFDKMKHKSKTKHTDLY